MVQGTDGNFYGTTFSGGAQNNGTVFKVTVKGALTTLYSFDGSDGSGAYSGLIQGSNGAFYGTTEVGGAQGNGTVFKITNKGELTTIHSFDNADGYAPAGLIQGTGGNLYGTTQGGGIAFGTVFQMTTKGALATLHSFDDNDGSDPQSAPLQATNGIFYGTTFFAGPGGYGTVFSLSMGLGPFVKTLPTTGKVGEKVIILGNDLTGATSVTFNGSSASFTVASDTEITATVPTGATTGTVKVTTPTRALESSMTFQVKP